MQKRLVRGTLATLCAVGALAVLLFSGAAQASGGPAPIAVTVSPGIVAAGRGFVVTAVAEDALGNRLTGYSAAAPRVVLHGAGTLSAVPSSFTGGLARATGATIDAPNHFATISVTSNGTTGTSRLFVVLGVLDHLMLKASPAKVAAASPIMVKAIAYDAAGNVETGYSDPSPTWSHTGFGTLSITAPFVHGIATPRRCRSR